MSETPSPAPSPERPPFFHKAWGVAIASFLVAALAALTSTATVGAVMQVAALLVFLASIVFYRAYVRICAVYEGGATFRNRVGNAVVVGAIAIAIIWFLVEWVVRGGVKAETARILAFFCSFVNFWLLWVMIFEHSHKEPPRSGGR